MLRTIEVLFVVVIILGAFVVTSQFAVLPSPRTMSSPGLRELALTTLQNLDEKGDLSQTAFSDPSDPCWGDLQIALSASFPPNVVYNLTVYDVNASVGTVSYDLVHSVSNSQGDLGGDSETASYVSSSSDVTYSVTAEKVGERTGNPLTLYILNCSDSNGWWITGYTAQTLAADVQNLLSPYFETTILVNSTNQLALLLNGVPLMGENVEDAVVINTFGEAVPIPTEYCNGESNASKGFDAAQNSYARYCHTLGQTVNLYNWTWVSIVGYPLYYVTNTVALAGSQNTFGIYGMRQTSRPGLNAFLQGLNNMGYTYDTDSVTRDVGQVQFTSKASELHNYYGIYPASYQWATRALSYSDLIGYYGFNISGSCIFDVKNDGGDDWIAGATYSHVGSDAQIHGALTAIGLTRIPDIRITVLGILMHYRPQLYRSDFGAGDSSKLIVLQLAQQGGS